MTTLTIWFCVWTAEHGTDGLAAFVVVSWQFVAVVALLAAAGWAALILAMIHGVRLSRVALRGVVALALTLVLAATAVNSYFSYLPTAGDVLAAAAGSNPPELSATLDAATTRSPVHGRLTLLPIPAGASRFGPSGAFVWLPPQYFTEPSRRFPVVYLFHGSPGMPADWFRAGQAGRIGLTLAAGDAPAILVAPQMSHGWLDDPECVDGIHEKVDTHFFADVIPTVDNRLRTEADRAGRVFAGMSAGGYCALNLGLRHPDAAATILDLSGYTQPTHSGGMKALFGPNDAGAVRANSPDLYAASLRPMPGSRIWLDSGNDDHVVEREMGQLAPVLRSRGFIVNEHVRPGDHTYSVWRPALRQALQWALPPQPA